MLLIACPLCGPRAGAEFTFERPMEAISPLDAGAEDVVARLYTRSNPRGVSAELWRHSHGCRAWMQIERDTATHAVGSVRLMGESE